jgi:WD40 repeat protein
VIFRSFLLSSFPFFSLLLSWDCFGTVFCTPHQMLEGIARLNAPPEPGFRLIRSTQPQHGKVESISVQPSGNVYGVVSVVRHSRSVGAAKNFWKGNPSQQDTYIELFGLPRDALIEPFGLDPRDPIFVYKAEKQHATIGWARGDYQVLIGLEGGRISVYDIYTQNLIGYYPLPQAEGRVLAFSPDGSYAATAARGVVNIYRLYGWWNGFGPSLYRRIPLPSLSEKSNQRALITGVVFSPSSDTVAVTIANRSLVAADVKSGNILAEFSPDDQGNIRISDVQYSPGGESIFMATRQGTFWFNLRTTLSFPYPAGTLGEFPADHMEDMSAVSVNARGRYWIRANREGTWRLFNSLTGETHPSWLGVPETLAMKLFGFRPYLLTIHEPNWVKLWEVRNVSEYVDSWR